MTWPHQVPEAGHWACSKSVTVCPGFLVCQSWHCVCAIVPFTKTRIERAEVCHWPECFLSSWGMFTEVWCFSKPLISSTPCPLYLYFSKCVGRTLFFASLPAFQNIPVAVNSMPSSESGHYDHGFVLQHYIHVFQIRESLLYRQLK